MDNSTKFVDALQDLMLQKDVKPDDIHKTTKISLPVIYDWLKKAAVPTLRSLTILSDYFQCSVDYLTGRADNTHFVLSSKPQTFSERLRLLININKVSIRKLSSETGIAKSAISYFLNGSIEPLLDNLIKLTVFFDCSIDYLIGRED